MSGYIMYFACSLLLSHVNMMSALVDSASKSELSAEHISDLKMMPHINHNERRIYPSSFLTTEEDVKVGGIVENTAGHIASHSQAPSWKHGASYHKSSGAGAQILMQEEAAATTANNAPDAEVPMEENRLQGAQEALEEAREVAGAAAEEQSHTGGASWRDGAYFHNPSISASKVLQHSKVTVGNSSQPSPLGGSWKQGAIYLNPDSVVAHYVQPTAGKAYVGAPATEEQEPLPAGKSWKDGAYLRKPGSSVESELPSSHMASIDKSAGPPVQILAQLDAGSNGGDGVAAEFVQSGSPAAEPLFSKPPSTLTISGGGLNKQNPNYGPVLTRIQGQVKRYGAYKTKDSCKYKSSQQGHACSSFFNYKCAQAVSPVGPEHPGYISRYYFPYDDATGEFSKTSVPSVPAVPTGSDLGASFIEFRTARTPAIPGL